MLDGIAYAALTIDAATRIRPLCAQTQPYKPAPVVPDSCLSFVWQRHVNFAVRTGENKETSVVVQHPQPNATASSAHQSAKLTELDIGAMLVTHRIY